ncbi:MAG: hypothetical protein AAF628_29235 [Planctomycetota bacterium]
MLTKLLPFSLSCVLLASAQAQSFNLNFTGSPTISVSDSYGGAAGQPGKWHSVDLQTSTPKSIRVLNGSYAGCLSILPSEPLSTFIWPDTHTCGTIENLLDSCAQVGPAGADIVISGVTPGSYRVTVYGRHPISCWYQCPPAAWFTDISVNGSATTTCGGGGGACGVTGPNPGITHREFTVTVTSSGKITINAKAKVGSPFGAINGVQVECLGGGLQCRCALQAAPVQALHANLSGGSGGTPISGTVQRHLQVHRDMAGGPLTISGQAFRRDALAAMVPGATSGMIDVELWVGEGDLDQVDPEFARNYQGNRVNVMRRRQVQLPDWSARSATSPAPFDFVLKYDRPFRYSGRGDFVWELIVHASSGSSGHPADADLPPTSRLGGSAPLGVGCVAFGQTQPLQASATFTTSDPANPTFGYQATVENGPPGAPAAVLLGFQNPAFPLPLCRPDLRLYTDGQVTIPGQLGPNGSLQLPAVQAPWSPVLADVPMFTQAATVDPTGLTVSNGVVSTIAGLPQPGPYAWVRATGSAQAPTGSVLHGAAIVTEIQP